MIDPRKISLSETDHPELVAALYETWSDYNGRFFNGELKTPFIRVGDFGLRGQGFYCVNNEYGIPFSEIRVNRCMIPPDGSLEYAADVLLHEMTHQLLRERNGYRRQGGDCHNGTFAGHCNRIGKALGLAGRVKSRRIYRRNGRGHSCESWPHCLRSPEYLAGFDRLWNQYRREVTARQERDQARATASTTRYVAAQRQIVVDYLAASGAPAFVLTAFDELCTRKNVGPAVYDFVHTEHVKAAFYLKGGGK